MNKGGVLRGAGVFAVRNIKELLRSPVSWGFGLILPVGLFVIMQIIMKSIGDAAAVVPMFDVSRFTGGVVIFGASFLSMFCALLISSDRQSSFLARLFASPVKPSGYFAGYVISILPLAVLQVLVTFVTALCFGLEPTVNILPAMLFSVLFSVLFIAIGILFGVALSPKSAPPVCSAVVQVAALLSGMWFDLDMIGGGFSVFCHVLPFAHCYDAVRYTLCGAWQNVWLPVVVVAAYMIVLSVAAIAVFRRGMKRL